MSHSIQWVVFDSTGTLMAPAPSVGEVYHRISQRFGSLRTVEEIAAQARLAMATHFGRPTVPEKGPPTNEAAERERWWRIVSDSLHDITAENQRLAFTHLWNHFASPSAWQLFDDVLPALERLSRTGVQIAVASNFDLRLIGLLTGLKISPHFHQILISSQLGWSKPDPRFFYEAANRLGLVAAEHALMIGDDLLNDVHASRAAGWNADLVDRQQGDSLMKVLDRWQLKG